MTVDGPQILIYHTHSQEGFADSVPGDPSTTIVGAGEYLAELLREIVDLKVMHVTSVYDLVDGELDQKRGIQPGREGDQPDFGRISVYSGSDRLAQGRSQ